MPVAEKEHPLTVYLRDAHLNANANVPKAQVPERALARIDEELRQPSLWGAVEVAECLGVSHTTMYKIVGLPEPVMKLRRGSLWSSYEVKDFARKRREQAHG